jgi:hypothetical protein
MVEEFLKEFDYTLFGTVELRKLSSADLARKESLKTANCN